MKSAAVVAILLATGMTAFPVQASSPQRLGFRLSGIVNTVCRVSFSEQSAALRDGNIDLGSLTQVCNDRAGFRVTMQHPAGMNGAKITIGSQTIALSSGTETVIIDENRAWFRTQSASLQIGDANVSSLALSFRVEPKGMIF